MNGRQVERLQSIWQFDIAQKKKKNFSRRGMNLVSTSTNFAYMTSVKYATTAREEVSLYMTFGKFLIMTLQWLSESLIDTLLSSSP